MVCLIPPFGVTPGTCWDRWEGPVKPPKKWLFQKKNKNNNNHHHHHFSQAFLFFPKKNIRHIPSMFFFLIPGLASCCGIGFSDGAAQPCHEDQPHGKPSWTSTARSTQPGVGWESKDLGGDWRIGFHEFVGWVMIIYIILYIIYYIYMIHTPLS